MLFLESCVVFLGKRRTGMHARFVVRITFEKVSACVYLMDREKLTTTCWHEADATRESLQ